MFNPLSNESLTAAAASSSSKAFSTVAFFKSKTKAPPKTKKVESKPKVEDGSLGPLEDLVLQSKMSSLLVVLP
ncbi:hypothetical protein CUMW_062170 [Citrus unshiu]|uniref:Uncharacterized protein n=1 Tax=Citrus unshiu TaxID=55188 RepID=A0A2H5NPD0_CITUN|nr:hypothetical protein CUMW_062170 [Citrus unshiu]GAY41792.1 hypothetical protein CUMW_062170 [Citrus unshiu]